MNKGYISIHRKILDWEWYDDINTCRIFIHLLLKANHETRKWRGIEVLRGQHVTSYSILASESSLSVRQVRVALNKLKLTGELTSRSTNEYTVITITKYDEYQANDKPHGKRMTSERQADDKRVTTNNNENNENNENKGESASTDATHPYKSKDSITAELIREIADKYSVPVGFVEDCWDSALNWLESSRKRKDNYRAFLINWVKREKANILLRKGDFSRFKTAVPDLEPEFDRFGHRIGGVKHEQV